MLKKALCLIFAFLLSINSFAAVVSDNDGSAFITKAEFDSLKNSFQAQLDSYNTGIDSKIDSAIASYLAGIKQEAQTTTNIINNSWKECSAISGVLNNTYQLPNIEFMFMMQYYHKVNSSSWSSDNGDNITETKGSAGALGNEYEGNFGHLMKLTQNTNWTSNYAYRNLVECTGDYVNPGDLIWAGRALKYSENLTMSKIVSTWLGSTKMIQWVGYFDRPDIRSFALDIRNVSTFKPSGYISNWKTSSNTAWPISYYWTSNTDYTANITWNSEKENNALLSTVELIPDNEGKAIDYEHIISYRNNSPWRVSNKSWTKQFRQAPDNALNSTNLYNASTKLNTAKGFSIAWFGMYNSNSGRRRDQVPIFWGELPVTHSITDNAVISSVGMLSSDVGAWDIYQDNEVRTITTNKTSAVKSRPTLEQGFQLLVNKKDAKITWQPVFNYTHVHNSASGYIDNNHEVDVYFSLAPFGDKLTSSSNLIKVKVNGATEKTDFATTVGRTCKIEFDMPDDGLVYVKWVPHETTYIDNDWIVTLDVKSSSTYMYQSDI